MIYIVCFRCFPFILRCFTIKKNWSRIKLAKEHIIKYNEKLKTLLAIILSTSKKFLFSHYKIKLSLVKRFFVFSLYFHYILNIPHTDAREKI